MGSLKKNRKKRPGSGLQKHKRSIVAITAVIILLCGMVIVHGMALKKSNDAYKVQEEELQTQIDAEKERSEEIDKLKKYVGTDEYIEELKTITPAYISYQKSSSEENFAANDFHEHNNADMEHFCLIELSEKDKDFTNEDYALFGKAPETIRKVKKAIAFFDDCLPDDFTKKKLGEYQYMFCIWAMPNNIKGMNN